MASENLLKPYCLTRFCLRQDSSLVPNRANRTRAPCHDRADLIGARRAPACGISWTMPSRSALAPGGPKPCSTSLLAVFGIAAAPRRVAYHKSRAFCKREAGIWSLLEGGSGNLKPSAKGSGNLEPFSKGEAGIWSLLEEGSGNLGPAGRGKR